MKRVLFAAGLILIAVGIPAQILDMPVAIVRLTETVNIGRRMLTTQTDLWAAQLGRQLTTTEKQQVLDGLVNDELLSQAAARANVRVTQEEISNYIELQRQQLSQSVGTVVTSEQFRQEVERQTGSAWSDYVEGETKRLIRLKYVHQQRPDLFGASLNPTTAEIQSFYEEQATSFTNPAMVSFRHIYIDLRGKTDAQHAESRTKMMAIRRSIRDGSSTFDSAAHATLDDPAVSSADFGYLLRNDPRSQSLLGKSFVDAVFALNVGDVSDVLESNVALHIVLITDKRAPRILNLDDPILPGQSVTVRQQITSILAAQKEQEALGQAVDGIVEDLRREAEVTIFENNLPW